MSRRSLSLALALIGLTSLAAYAGMLDAAWEALTGHRLEVAGAPVAADHAKLSEHNLEWLETQPPQVQAEFLLSSAIRYERGATDRIADSVDAWRGQLSRTPEWERLTKIALYTSDLRVRAAAIEIDLAVNQVPKIDASAERVIEIAERHDDARPWALWTLGMLANRGIQPERLFEFLVDATYDPIDEYRIWAVEGLAHLGTDATIPEFIRILGTDASMKVRERAGCSLAKSGMLSRGQRMQAVPGLIDLADDPSLDPTARRWVFQALREITNVSMGDDPDEWRHWYSSGGMEAQRSFDSEPWKVLGNH